MIPTPTVDLSRSSLLHPGIASRRIRMQFKSKVVLEITHRERCPDRARVVPTLGRMVFQFEQAGNGEGLENRAFICIVLYSELAEPSGLVD